MNQPDPRDKGRARKEPPRLTPYELAFGAPVFETRVFPLLLREAQTAGVDLARPERFAFLSAGSDALRDVIPPDAPAEALEQYRALLFHSFNLWRFGKRIYLLESPVARFLVEAQPRLQGWDLQMPYGSLYIQLPANLFWASITPESTPEPVDGFFLTVADADDPLGPPAERLNVLLVLGIRRERAGFSVIPFDTEVGVGIPAVWAEAAGREGGRDFDTTLPGGDLAGLYSVVTTAEALKLAARALWYIDRHPEDVISEDAPEQRTPEDAERWSRLPVHRVRLGGAATADAAES